MANVAPGYRSSTACASTWAVEWRIVCRPLSDDAVTISTDAPSDSGATMSRSAPSTTAISASAASRGPTAAARSAPLDPSGSSRREPSGSETVIADIAAEATSAPCIRIRRRVPPLPRASESADADACRRWRVRP